MNLLNDLSHSPRNGDIGALPGDINETIIIIAQGAAINPDMPRVRFDLNAIYIMTPSAFKFQIAYDNMLTFLEP